MTSGAPPSPGPAGDHLDLDRLADLDEGLVDAAGAAMMQRHLEGCASCRALNDHLQATKRVLGSLPDAPLPAAVAERLDAALAGAAGSATVVPLAPRRVWWRSPQFATAGAAAAVVALVAAIVVGKTSHSAPSNGEAAPASTGLGAGFIKIPQAVTSSGQTYSPGNLTRLLSGLEARAATGTTALGGGSQAGPTGVHVATPSPGGAASVAGAQTAAAVPPQLRPLSTNPARLLACFRTLAAGAVGARVLAVDYGYYTNPNTKVNHAPAAVILFSGIDPGGADVAYIVGPECDRSFYQYYRVPPH